jgi:hypothetical protein
MDVGGVIRGQSTVSLMSPADVPTIPFNPHARHTPF